MIKVIKDKTVILVSSDDRVTYHHVGQMDSGMCYLTNKNQDIVYAGDDNIEWFTVSNLNEND